MEKYQPVLHVTKRRITVKLTEYVYTSADNLEDTPCYCL
jgi:hypothetical protein